MPPPGTGSLHTHTAPHLEADQEPEQLLENRRVLDMQLTCLKVGDVWIVAEEPQIPNALMRDAAPQKSYRSCSAS